VAEEATRVDTQGLKLLSSRADIRDWYTESNGAIRSIPRKVMFMTTRRELLEFVIDAYSPETLPMSRLAEYMASLATLLGQPGPHPRRSS